MNAAIYARYSSDNQDIASIDAQVRAIKEYCEKLNYNVVTIYIDEAETATTDDRPQFLKMIEDSSKGLFDLLVVHKLDRFARNRYDSAFYKRQLKNNNVKVLSVLERLDDSPESIILESVLEGMAEYFSVNLARETMKGLKENAHKAMHCGGKPALGYDIIDKKYVINENEAEIIRFIFNSYANRIGYKQIASECNNRGYKSKLGKPIAVNSLHDILKNEKYAGIYVFNKYSKGTTTKMKAESEIIRIPGGVPAIIDLDMFNMVQMRLKDNKHNATNKAKHNYLLTGKLICGDCGARMIGHTAISKAGKEYSSYYCGNRYRTKTCKMKPVGCNFIENDVINTLRYKIFNDKKIKSVSQDILREHEITKKQFNSDLKLLEKQLKEIDNNINNMVEAISNGMYHQTMKNKMDELEENKQSIGKMIFNIRINESINKYDINSIRKRLFEDKALLESKEPDKQRHVINVYVESVIMYNDHSKTNLFIHKDGDPNPLRIVCINTFDSR